MDIQKQILIRSADTVSAIALNPNKSILDSCLSANIALPYSCRRGDCGQCLAKVIESDNPSLKSDDVCELCQIPASHAGHFEMVQNHSTPAIKPELYPAKVRNVEIVANDIYRLRLQLPKLAKFNFEGGQYASIVIRSDLERNYSIGEFDAHNLNLDFYVKRIEDGKFGSWLAEAQPGTLVRMRAPMGSFCLSSKKYDSSWFVATGTGIVPIFSMLQNAAKDARSNLGKIYIVWGNRISNDVFLKQELQVLCEKMSIELEFVFSRSGYSRHRYVTKSIENIDFSHCALYAAGHPEMVKNARTIAINNSINITDFYSDAFVFSEFTK
jgi:CDP-4-dehydro-6-deoxyglucose reductase